MERRKSLAPSMPSSDSLSAQSDGAAHGPQQYCIMARGQLLTLQSKAILKELPLLETMSTTYVPQERTSNGVLVVDEDPDILMACLYFAETRPDYSPSTLLIGLATRCTVKELVDRLDYLCMKDFTISTPDQLQNLERTLKNIKLDRRPWKCYRAPDARLARDAAAILCLSIAKCTLPLDSDSTMRQKVTNDVLFVLSHTKTFPSRIRTHLWQCFSSLYTLTTKQEKLFGRWISDEGLAYHHELDLS
jgi:hypothetical protein